eukprot:TRINITY_DN5587_c0_g1_i1.p1 TRINITY_DN5587_c0_g1~~TRINITY_DN5587_c0_g1_i1.p1  ORF type:complete len:107 (-),score=9.35 TRINITY_DN5587_c0_g1_i1:110-430(-)
MSWGRLTFKQSQNCFYLYRSCTADSPGNMVVEADNYDRFPISFPTAVTRNIRMHALNVCPALHKSLSLSPSCAAFNDHPPPITHHTLPPVHLERSRSKGFLLLDTD